METTYIIRIACKRVIKRAFKLFDDETRCSSLQQIIEKLRLTSKHFNNSICNELSLEIMHRWMKGRDRCARVTKRIEQLLHKCDYNGLFRFMDAVSKTFTKREAVRLLSSFLVTITQHHRHMLKDYTDFFTSRKLHMTMKEYYVEPRSFPFPGFTPQQVEKSLQIANENGWIEESLLLFNHFITKYFFNLDETDGHKVRLAMSSGQKLNFSANLANRINNVSRHGHIVTHSGSINHWLARYLEAEQITTTDLTKVLHSVSSHRVQEILAQSSPSTANCAVISFYGPQLIRYYCRRNDSKRKVHSQNISKSTTTFTALCPAPENCQATSIYYFYCAVVDNDLETAKKFQLQHNIHIGKIMDEVQGIPLLQYLKNTGSVQQETVDFLVYSYGGLGDCLHDWKRELTSEVWTIIKNLINKGAIIYTMPIWERFFIEKSPRTAQEFQTILDATDRWIFEDAISFMFHKLYEPYLRIRSQVETLILLAWQYDSTCHLSKLPKELLKVIMTCADETPLFFQYPSMIMKKLSQCDKISCPSEVLECTGEIARFVRDHSNKLLDPWFTLLNYKSERAVKRDEKYLREIMQRKLSSSYPAAKVFSYFCKYESDEQTLKDFLNNLVNSNPRYFIKKYPFLEYAAVATNISFLHEFYKAPGNIDLLPNKDVYASIAPKRRNKMCFEDALALVNQVRCQYSGQNNVN